jgi:hypothetical protein
MKKKFNSAKVAAAARREAHFAAGGTPAMWRGRAATFTDRKKAANKRACRSYR